MNERIRKLRKTLDLTQREFGERLGIKGNTIANYELGRNEPIDAVVSLICREFNVNEEWLRTGEGEMFIEIPEEDEEMKYIALLLKDKEDAVAKAVKGFIVEYKKLNPANQKVIQDLLKNTLTYLKE